MKRLSLVFVVAFLAMFVAAGAAEEQPWCGEAEESGVDEPEMSAMVAYCEGVPPQQMPACCNAYAQDAYAQCYESYYNNLESLCMQEVYAYCYNYAYQLMPPNCYGSSACMFYFNQAFQECFNTWEAQQVLYSCSWDWINRLIPMYCQSEATAAYSYCMSGN